MRCLRYMGKADADASGRVLPGNLSGKPDGGCVPGQTKLKINFALGGKLAVTLHCHATFTEVKHSRGCVFHCTVRNGGFGVQRDPRMASPLSPHKAACRTQTAQGAFCRNWLVNDEVHTSAEYVMNSIPSINQG